MRRPVVVVGFGAVVLGAGLWIGRSSSSEAKVEVASTEMRAEPVERAPARSAQVPALPSLRRAPKAALPGLAADLIAADPKVRLAAVREVARSGEPDAQTLLVASRDPDPSVAAAAIGSLAKLYADGQVATSDMLARAADKTGGARIHSMALNAVGTVPHADAAKMLTELAVSGDVVERRAATALLGSQAAEDAIPALIRALSDADEYVRDNGANGLRALSRGRDFGTDAGAWQAWWQSRR